MIRLNDLGGVHWASNKETGDYGIKQRNNFSPHNSHSEYDQNWPPRGSCIHLQQTAGIPVARDDFFLFPNLILVFQDREMSRNRITRDANAISLPS